MRAAHGLAGGAGKVAYGALEPAKIWQVGRAYCNGCAARAALSNDVCEQ